MALPMQRFPWLVFFLGLLALTPGLRAEAEWTVLAYMSGDDAGDAPMEKIQIESLLESAEYVAKGGPVHFVAQLDRAPKRTRDLKKFYHNGDYAGASRYVIEGQKVLEVEQLGEVNCGDPTTLYDFLRWGVKNYPAKRYALIMSGHGSGILSWRGTGSVVDPQPGKVNFDPFTTYDDTDNDTLTVFELTRVLESFKSRLNGGKKLDLIAFESCLPGAIEAVYEMRDAVKLYVGSPDVTYYKTFPYRHMLHALGAQPGQGPSQLAEVLCKNFIERSKDNSAPDAMMAWRTDRAEDIVSALSRLSIELLRAAKAGAELSFHEQYAYWDEPHYYWDLSKIAEACARGTTGVAKAPNFPSIQELGRELYDAIRQARVAGWYDGAMADQKVGGLSIYWPKKGETHQQYQRYYKAFRMSKDSAWDEFVDRMKLGIEP